MSPPPILRTPAQAVPIRLPSQEPTQSFRNQTCHRVRHQFHYKAHLPFLRKVKKRNARLQTCTDISRHPVASRPRIHCRGLVAKVGPMTARLSQLDFKRVPPKQHTTWAVRGTLVVGCPQVADRAQMCSLCAADVWPTSVQP